MPPTKSIFITVRGLCLKANLLKRIVQTFNFSASMPALCRADTVSINCFLTLELLRICIIDGGLSGFTAMPLVNQFVGSSALVGREPMVPTFLLEYPHEIFCSLQDLRFIRQLPEERGVLESRDEDIGILGGSSVRCRRELLAGNSECLERGWGCP